MKMIILAAVLPIGLVLATSLLITLVRGAHGAPAQDAGRRGERLVRPEHL